MVDDPTMTETATSESPGILIVEDEALVARDIQSRLQQLGHTVAGVAHNPRQAIQMAEELQPGLLLCDIHLKDEIDGIDVARAIMEKRDIPVIFLTAYSDKETVAKAKAIAPYGYVLKPIETQDLQITVEMALHKFKIEQELRETRQLLATALKCIGDALVFVDGQGAITNINKEAEGLFACSSKQVAGGDWQQLFGLHEQRGDRSTQQFLQRALSSDAVTRLPPFSIVRGDGCQVLLDGIVGPTHKKGETSGAVLMLRELAELHDPVENLPRPTDLPAFDEFSSFPQDSERAFVLLLITPDHYEELVQSIDKEDQQVLLQEISEELNRAMRSSDLAAHYGGAVFSASLPYTSLDEANSIAEAIMQKLDGQLFLQGRIALTLSIGMAHCRAGVAGAEEESPLEIFRRANWALNLARQSGGNKVVIWRPSADIDMIGEHDRQSGLLAADSGRDYRNMVLLWNTMNTVARSTDVRDLAQKLVVHFRKSFALELAGIFWQLEPGLQLIASDPPLPQEIPQNLDLQPVHVRLIEAAVSGANLDANGIAREGATHCIPLHQGGECRGILYVVAQGTGADLRPKDLAFMRTLLEYIAGPLGQPESSSADTAKAKASPTDSDATLLYQSDAMTGVMEHIRLVAPTDATVLVTGESGTGKEVISREIHRLSDRSDKPFVIVDCGAIVASLIESELFGHVKGAFTGADAARIGKLKEADGGTILLDEIGELATDVQAKLLRVVQDKKFTAVGSTQFQSIDTRIIAATNVDLEARIREGRFREDLFYRLNVFTVHSPPLRERGEDILILANHFLQSCSRQYKKNIEGFTSDATEALQHYQWPGNVRELRNRLIRAVILCQDTKIDKALLDLPVSSEASPPAPTSLTPGVENHVKTKGLEDVEAALRMALGKEVQHCLSERILPPLGEWLQEDLIKASLEIHQHINLHAAQALGIPESTLRRKVAAFSTDGEASRSPDWHTVVGLLSEWIEINKQAPVDSRQRLHNVLIGQISDQCQVQMEAAALAGVSTPTYRRQLSKLSPGGISSPLRM